MIQYHTIVDIGLFLLFAFGVYYSYTHRSYVKTFAFFKAVVLIALAAKFSHTMAIWLQDFSITKADTYTTLLLIAFVINFLIAYAAFSALAHLSATVVNNATIKGVLAKLFTVFEVLVVSTFSLYIVMQLYVSKVHIYPVMSQTYLYPKIERFYHGFLSDDLVRMVMGFQAGTSRKEVIFESFKKSF
jgi:hypothetical protein